MDAQPETNKPVWRTQSENFSGSGPDSINSNKVNRQSGLGGKKLIEAKKRAEQLEREKKMRKMGQPF